MATKIPDQWPRRMRRKTAAAYLDMDLATFDTRWKKGEYVQPYYERRTPFWLKDELDDMLDMQFGRKKGNGWLRAVDAD